MRAWMPAAATGCVRPGASPLKRDFVCRLLNHMAARDAHRVEVTLRPEDAGVTLSPWIDENTFNPGYLRRRLDQMPQRGDKPEWMHDQDYWREKDEIPGIDLDGAAFVYDGVRTAAAPEATVAA